MMDDRIVKADPRYKGQLLNEDELKRVKNALIREVAAKKARYFCFRIQDLLSKGEDVVGIPEGFKEYVEGLEGFEVFGGWEGFAKRWDLMGKNPFYILLRLRSVWEEWEQIMERCAIPLNATKEEIIARQEILIRQYNSKNN